MAGENQNAESQDNGIDTGSEPGTETVESLKAQLAKAQSDLQGALTAKKREGDLAKKSKDQLMALYTGVSELLGEDSSLVKNGTKNPLDAFHDLQAQEKLEQRIAQAKQQAAQESDDRYSQELQSLKRKNAEQQQYIDDSTINDFISRAFIDAGGKSGDYAKWQRNIEADDNITFGIRKDEQGTPVRDEFGRVQFSGIYQNGKLMRAEDRDKIVMGQDAVDAGSPLTPEALAYRYRQDKDSYMSHFFNPISTSSGAGTTRILSSGNGQAHYKSMADATTAYQKEYGTMAGFAAALGTKFTVESE